MVRTKEDGRMVAHHISSTTGRRRTSSRITDYKISDLKKDLSAWLFTLFITLLVIAGITELLSCSGNQKPTINMTNCTIIESPVEGNMKITCEVISEDMQKVNKQLMPKVPKEQEKK